MKESINYKLKKPEQTDYINIEDFNDNADIIDAELKNQDETIKTHLADIVSQAAPNKIPRALATGKLDIGWIPNDVDLQIFTTSGIWNKPDNINWVMVDIISGGAGGDAGKYSSSSTKASGGSGGGGGGRLIKILPAPLFNDIENVVVGAGGSGGVGGPYTNQDVSGGSGGSSSFANIIVTGGNRTSGGGLGVAFGGYGMGNIGADKIPFETNSDSVGGPAEYGGGGGGYVTSYKSGDGGSSIFGGGGGGAGGSGSNQANDNKAGIGGKTNVYEKGIAGALLTSPEVGTNGNLLVCGSGGDGGYGSINYATAAGANGGIPAGGGGGGGTSYSANIGQNGGNGGRGEVRVYAW